MQLPNILKTPSFFQGFHWFADPIGFMEKAAQQYPDIFTARLVDYRGRVVFVNHPQAIQFIFTNDGGKKLATSDKLDKFFLPITGDCSMMVSQGERHKRKRQLVMPAFHKERMQAYGELICNVTEKCFDRLLQNQPFSARVAMQDIALQVTLQAVLGLTEGEHYEQLKRLIVLMMKIFQPLNTSFLFFPFLQKDLGAWNSWGRFVRYRQMIDKIIYAEIAKRREQPDSNRIDILSLLMLARDEEGEAMTDQELRDEIVTLLAAGMETTAVAMTWNLYWTHQKPGVREKLLQELGSLGDSPDPMSIAKLPYLTAVCNETLRIHPVGVVTFPRKVQEPVELLGHKLKPGTILVPCPYLLHQREDLYPQPKQFQPERFLERQFSPYEFIPFGGGVRRCIGQAFALFEMKLVLATILQRYQLALADNRPERPVRRGTGTGPARGVKMVITAYTSQVVRQELVNSSR
jgi:unspecific monooxygenase